MRRQSLVISSRGTGVPRALGLGFLKPFLCGVGSHAGPVEPGGARTPVHTHADETGSRGAAALSLGPHPGHLPLSPTDLRPHGEQSLPVSPEAGGVFSEDEAEPHGGPQLPPPPPSQLIPTCEHRFVCAGLRTCGGMRGGCQGPQMGTPCRGLWAPCAPVGSGLRPTQCTDGAGSHLGLPGNWHSSTAIGNGQCGA